MILNFLIDGLCLFQYHTAFFIENFKGYENK